MHDIQGDRFEVAPKTGRSVPRQIMRVITKRNFLTRTCMSPKSVGYGVGLTKEGAILTKNRDSVRDDTREK